MVLDIRALNEIIQLSERKDTILDYANLAGHRFYKKSRYENQTALQEALHTVRQVKQRIIKAEKNPKLIGSLQEEISLEKINLEKATYKNYQEQFKEKYAKELKFLTILKSRDESRSLEDAEVLYDHTPAEDPSLEAYAKAEAKSVLSNEEFKNFLQKLSFKADIEPTWLEENLSSTEMDELKSLVQFKLTSGNLNCQTGKAETSFDCDALLAALFPDNERGHEYFPL